MSIGENVDDAREKLPRPQEGLCRLAASAALIHACLAQGDGFASENLLSPELRMGPDGEVEAWVDSGGSKTELFSVSPNRFGKLAFGFACDHFKMLHEEYWSELRAAASGAGAVVTILAPQPFVASSSQGLTEVLPERMTAPALMALCQRMAGSPEWLMGALDELERGVIPRPPLPSAKPKQARP